MTVNGDAGALLKWTAQLGAHASTRTSRLPGDKIILPPSALEQLLSASDTAAVASLDPTPARDPWNRRAYQQYQADLQERQTRLPHPLTFRLVNPENGRVVYAGIQEFSAEEEQVILSPLLRKHLGLRDETLAEKDARPIVTVHFRQLQKGTYVKLRPLEAGYDAEDWKALLEQHMRANFTTLTKGEVIEVEGDTGLGQKSESFRFLVDEFGPDDEAICVVDTDLEVDIEALNEEQARETVKRIAAKYQNGTSGVGTSKGGNLDLFREQHGQVVPGEYVDYQLPSWPRDQSITFELVRDIDGQDVDLLFSPFSAHQRSHPRIDMYALADLEDRPSKRIKLEPTNIELEGAEALYVSVHAFKTVQTDREGEVGDGAARPFTLRVKLASDASTSDSDNFMADAIPPHDSDVRCKNCHQWVPGRSLMLHENFCLRNNIICPHGCGQVFQKRGPAFESHWHCDRDTSFGSGSSTQSKHNILYHPASPLRCDRCNTTQTFSTLPLLAQHRTTTCPAKPILCRFCHLNVPQGGDADAGPSPESLLSGLTPHELEDGGRTTDCHLCGRIVRLRDMAAHLKSHDLDRRTRARPRVCRNALCGNTLGTDPGNDLGLCATCFAPLYVTMYDPEGKAMRRRVERRYLQQLMTGCGKSWCGNRSCRTGRKNLGLEEEGTNAKAALALAKPHVQGMMDGQGEVRFCVDEGCQQRRQGAETMEAEGRAFMPGRSWALPWCIAAVEAEGGNLGKARTWLENWAPRVDEEKL